MPLRRYIVIKPDGADGEEFEVDLPSAAPDFTHHPVTKEPCRRVLEFPTLTTQYGDGAMKQGLSDQRLARAGFQKLEKDGQGGWNKIN
ncbi:MAG: FmdB family transcriptional regulator [Verrucomicrobiota bacterium]